MNKLLVAACALALLPGGALAQQYHGRGGGHYSVPPTHSAPSHGPSGHAGPIGGSFHGGPGSGGSFHGGASAGGAFRGGPGHGGPAYGGHPHFASGPVGRFTVRDQASWRGGYWWHGWRGGRLGWWWFVDGFWYWYAAPAYPYPLYVPDYFVAGEMPAPGGPMWYYCYNPPGYYPQVRACAGPWRPVPAPAPPPPP